MNTQYRKNLKAVLEASKTYCDESIESLKWELGTYDLSVDTNTDTKHIKQLPSGTIQTTVAKVEGVGYKVNQLVVNGNFSDSTGWNGNACSIVANNNVLTMTSTSVSSACGVYRSMPTDNSHKFLVIFEAKSDDITSDITSNKMTPSANFGALTSSWKFFSGIYNTFNSNSLSLYTSSASIGITWQLRNVNIFDLTADFGSGNEPSTVSDAASAYLPRGINIYDYTPQQSSIKNNAFTGVKVEGANVIGLEDVEETTINGMKYKVENNEITLTNVPSSNTSIWLRITDTTFKSGINYLSKLNVLSGSTSNISMALRKELNTNEDNISYSPSGTSITGNGKTYKYLLLYVQTTFGGSLKCNMMTNYGSTALSYVPYITPTTLPIDLSSILYNGNPLFEGNSLKAVNDVKDILTPYKATKKLGYIDLGSLDWEIVNNSFRANISDLYSYTIPSDLPNVLTAKYPTIKYADWYSDTDKFVCVETGASNRLVIKDTSYATVEAFKTAMSGVYLVYELGTPIEVDIDLSQLTRINAQSNGTITLNNTDNVDMPNTIKSLKEVAK